jgi:hypothetical protein
MRCGHVWMMGELTDVVLWQRLLEGDDDAFAELFARHVDAVANYAFRRVADWSTAEDVASLFFSKPGGIAGACNSIRSQCCRG